MSMVQQIHSRVDPPIGGCSDLILALADDLITHSETRHQACDTTLCTTSIKILFICCLLSNCSGSYLNLLQVSDRIRYSACKTSTVIVGFRHQLETELHSKSHVTCCQHHTLYFKSTMSSDTEGNRSKRMGRGVDDRNALKNPNAVFESALKACCPNLGSEEPLTCDLHDNAVLADIRSFINSNIYDMSTNDGRHASEEADAWCVSPFENAVYADSSALTEKSSPIEIVLLPSKSKEISLLITQEEKYNCTVDVVRVEESLGDEHSWDAVSEAINNHVSLAVDRARDYLESKSRARDTNDDENNNWMIVVKSNDSGGARKHECWNEDIPATPTLIGSGSYGKVYQAHIRGQGRAMKEVISDFNSLNTTIQEAEISIRLSHPNIVKTFSYRICEHDPLGALMLGNPMFTMNTKMQDDGINDIQFKVEMEQELCDLGTLKQYVCNNNNKKNKKCSSYNDDQIPKADSIVLICLDIIYALMALDQFNIVHNDLSSSNVLLSTDVSTPLGMRAKISDFGLSWSDISPNQNSHGTAMYMPPEVFAENDSLRITPGSSRDVYSLGVLIVEMWLGECPWGAAKPFQVAYGMSIGKRLTVPKDIPPHLKNVVQQCLAENPDDRPTPIELERMLSVIPDQEELVKAHTALLVAHGFSAYLK
jgi:hypothetical protein